MFSAIVSAPPLWQSPFFLRPLFFLVLFGIASGAVGTLVNLRNWQFGAEASVHSIFPGIVVGAVLLMIRLRIIEQRMRRAMQAAQA